MDVPRRISHYPRRDGPLPEGAKWVGRPTRFGNPHDARVLGREEAARRHREDFHAGRLSVTEEDVLALGEYEALACVCPLDVTCHADLYVEILEARAAEG